MSLCASPVWTGRRDVKFHQRQFEDQSVQSLSRIGFRLVVAGLLSLAGFANAQHVADAPGHMQHSANAEIETLAALRSGGTVIFIRHERTDVTRLDDQHFVLADCSTQRNLSVAGVANSIQTGDYIRRLRIPIGTVPASPMCRCSETARLAFGRVQTSPLLMGNWTQTNRSMDDAGRDLIQLVKNQIRAGTNTVLVAHFSNAFRAFGVRLNEGDAVVLRLDARGEPAIVGTIGAHRWGDLIRDETEGRPRADPALPAR
jgi:phosphohistidine phosphatase SixA